jgi:ABC-2 type transport system permease protein
MKAFLDKYRVLVGIYVKMYRKYQMELFLKLIYLPVQMLMYVFLWKVLLHQGGAEQSYMICYYLFVVLLGYAFPFVHIATDIQKDVEQGTMTTFLVRPVQYVVPVISRYLAWMVCYSVIFVPAVLFTVIYRGISLQNLGLFFIYLVLGTGIEFLIWYNLGLLALKIERIRGVLITFRAFKSLVSGSLIPISLFPQLLRTVTEFLPMKFYIYTPVNALLDGERVGESAGNMVLALAWIAVLTAVAALQWNSGLKKLQVNIS